MTKTTAGNRIRTRLRPDQSSGEKPKLDRHWRSKFLEALAETSNVARSADIAGINAARAYKVRREEPEFRAKWMEALREGYAHLEMETLHRLRMGTAAGKDDPKFDIANALRLLSMHRASVAHVEARERVHNQNGDSMLEALKAKLDLMQEREAEMAREEEEAGQGLWDNHADD